MNDIQVQGGILNHADPEKNRLLGGFKSLRKALNYLAKCCGVYCCDGGSYLGLPDRTTGKTIKIYVENDVLKMLLSDGTTIEVISGVGTQGAQGFQGAGAQGAQGSQGTQGAQGFQGAP